MKISFSTPMENTVTTHGYGVAAFGIVTALQRLGHEVPFQDPSAPVELNFSQPYLWRWSSPDSYKIGYAAWESTKIPSSWRPGLATCDELWTPSPVMAELFSAQGYPARVYEHGVDSTVWTPQLRRRENGPIRFLHIGEPAPRKGGQLTYDVFKELFGGQDDVATLTIKAHAQSTIRGARNAHPWNEISNVKVIIDELPEYALVDLVRRHDVLVYPSWGEGFGLIPLQAMATGMPVICTEAWAPYRPLILPRLRLGSTLQDSPWGFHTGQMWRPDRDDLVKSMTYAVDNFRKVSLGAMSLVPYVTKRYGWDALTRNAFAHVVERFDS